MGIDPEEASDRTGAGTAGKDIHMIEVSSQKGEVQLLARVLSAGEDLCIVITGGTCPHIGSVSIGIPRSSLKGDATASATVSTFNVTSHKDDRIGNLFAHEISAQVGCRTVVTCGIHVDDASDEVLEAIQITALDVLKRLKVQLSETPPLVG